LRDLIGRALGHYRIVEKIGKGGMGEVCRAYDEQVGCSSAAEVLLPLWCGDLVFRWA